jgi:hypothetical protein
MDLISGNLSTIVVGALIFGVLGLVVFRLIRAIRRGQSACGCGCAGCEGRAGGKEPAGPHSPA